MIKIYISNIAKTVIGGAFSFLDNFKKGMEEKIEIVNDWQNCDIVFIVASPLISEKVFDKVKIAGKKILLRVDGIPEDWRNQGNGWAPLKKFAKESDSVVYQSEFSRDTVGKLVGRDGDVIYNGVDRSIFKIDETVAKIGDPSILFVYYRDDPNKRLDEVITRFRYYKFYNSNACLIFVGNYPNHIKEYNFGMLEMRKDKDWLYRGIVSNKKEMAAIMNRVNYIAYPSFADPCPNTLIEALSCGCKLLWINEYGGQKEIIDKWNSIDWSLERMCDEYYKVFEKLV